MCLRLCSGGSLAGTAPTVKQRHSRPALARHGDSLGGAIWRLAILIALIPAASGCTTLPGVVDRPYQPAVGPLAVTSIGHATFLIELDGQLILTDPWFYEGPLTGRHPYGLGISPGRVPTPDVILITHGHRDHFDQRFLAELADKNRPVVVVPGSMVAEVEALRFSRVMGAELWDHVQVKNLTITAAPAEHYGETLAYIIEGAGYTLFFAAETTLFAGLGEVAARFPRIDVAFLPADGLQLRWGRSLAMDHEEAAKAVDILGPEVVIPVLDHDFSRSVARLILTTTGSAEAFAALVAETRPHVNVALLRPGLTGSTAKKALSGGV